ncbi:MAG TPA: hypothetical protein VJ000_00540, partial [Thermodesulfovibrionia bacterium]|nr:hypothetical protein [Thermodesulfovibrionia bacterium]
NITVVNGFSFTQLCKFDRRLPSFQGPIIISTNRVPLHEVPSSNLYFTKGTYTFDEKGERMEIKEGPLKGVYPLD